VHYPVVHYGHLISLLSTEEITVVWTCGSNEVNTKGRGNLLENMFGRLRRCEVNIKMILKK
jgi:hypothetical protein